MTKRKGISLEAFSRLFNRLTKEMRYIPKEGKAQSSCRKCIGVSECVHKKKRDPDAECLAFWPNDKKIVIRTKEQT